MDNYTEKKVKAEKKYRSLWSGIVPVCLFFAMLTAPEAVFKGAQDGLLLWFRTIFPTLFPFMTVSGIMIAGGGLSVISAVLGRPFSALLATSGNGVIAVLTGFLCGYPAGAKTTADLIHAGRISRDEGAYLLSFCNNVSPGFVINYIVLGIFNEKNLILPSLLILNAVPLLLSLFFRRKYLKGKKRFQNESCGYISGDHSEKKFDFSALDTCLMQSFEAIVKVGLYIIVFSVLTGLAGGIGRKYPFIKPCLPFLEITNGIRMVGSAVQDLTVSYPFILGLTSFGGICAAAQTKSMISGCGIPIAPYIAQKLAAAAAASFIGFLYISNI